MGKNEKKKKKKKQVPIPFGNQLRILDQKFEMVMNVVLNQAFQFNNWKIKTL